MSPGFLGLLWSMRHVPWQLSSCRPRTPSQVSSSGKCVRASPRLTLRTSLLKNDSQASRHRPVAVVCPAALVHRSAPCRAPCMPVRWPMGQEAAPTPLVHVTCRGRRRRWLSMALMLRSGEMCGLRQAERQTQVPMARVRIWIRTRHPRPQTCSTMYFACYGGAADCSLGCGVLGWWCSSQRRMRPPRRPRLTSSTELGCGSLAQTLISL
mmetsp:Transcript_41577/g.93959  ORF Transcript_41577/g.93959 Transcript_41577/m.93959 type:complete len:210 (+) Transcript_41577:751-1380(+)